MLGWRFGDGVRGSAEGRVGYAWAILWGEVSGSGRGWMDGLCSGGVVKVGNAAVVGGGWVVFERCRRGRDKGRGGVGCHETSVVTCSPHTAAVHPRLFVLQQLGWTTIYVPVMH